MSNNHDPKHELNTSNEYEASKTTWMWGLGILSFIIFVIAIIILEIRST